MTARRRKSTRQQQTNRTVTGRAKQNHNTRRQTQGAAKRRLVRTASGGARMIQRQTRLCCPARKPNEAVAMCRCSAVDSTSAFWLFKYSYLNTRTHSLMCRCPHLFHKQCLKSWFATKMQCPVCGTVYGIITGRLDFLVVLLSEIYIMLQATSLTAR